MRWRQMQQSSSQRSFWMNWMRSIGSMLRGKQHERHHCHQ
jgi:hypothetical protein